VLIKDEHARVLQAVDALATPTALIAAPRIDAPPVALGGAEYRVRGPGSGLLARCTNPSNATGPPAITVPCGFSRAGLPIGVQFIGRPFDEARLVQAAHAYEEVSPSRGRRPAIVDTAEERNNPRRARYVSPHDRLAQTARQPHFQGSWGAQRAGPSRGMPLGHGRSFGP